MRAYPVERFNELRYKFKKARKVLTSPDPEYRTKRIELLQSSDRRVEPLAPSLHGRDEIAGLEPGIVGSDVPETSANASST
jgi:hypothetical protein